MGETSDSRTQIPRNCPFRGSIFGYFAYIKGWPKFVHETAEKIASKVWADNSGQATIVCADAGSCESLLNAQQVHGCPEGNAVSLNLGLCPYKDLHPLFEHTWVDRDCERLKRT